MQFQLKNLNKVRALLYAILKYYFKQYLEFGSVSLFCIWQEIIFVLGSIRFNQESMDSKFLHIIDLCRG